MHVCIIKWNRSIKTHLFEGKYYFMGASLVAQMVKRLPAMRESWVRSLGREDPLEKEMATHSSILAWKISWMEPGRLQSMGSQRLGHDWMTSLHFTISWNYAPIPCFGSSNGKESACNAGELGSIAGLGRSPGEGKGYPLQYSGLENSMDSPWVAKSRTQLSDFHFHFWQWEEIVWFFVLFHNMLSFWQDKTLVILLAYKSLSWSISGLWNVKIWQQLYECCPFSSSKKTHHGGFPGGSVVKNLPTSAGEDTGLIPGQGRSHMPWSN